MALVLIIGVPLAVWGTWLRLGRTPSARRWASGDSPERSMFSIPFFGGALVLIAAGALADGVRALATVLTLAGVVCFLIALVFGMLRAPAPAFLKPRWYREIEKRTPTKRAPRKAHPVAVPPAARTAPTVEPAWRPVRDALRADVTALQPEGLVELRADAQHYVLIYHYGDRLSVDCAGSQAWGGDAPVTAAQEERLLALGFTTPLQRRREIETTTSYRCTIATDRPEHAQEAADLAVTALSILGVQPDAHLDQVRS